MKLRWNSLREENENHVISPRNSLRGMNANQVRSPLRNCWRKVLALTKRSECK